VLPCICIHADVENLDPDDLAGRIAVHEHLGDNFLLRRDNGIAYPVPDVR
jgi:hypothetical protein